MNYTDLVGISGGWLNTSAVPDKRFLTGSKTTSKRKGKGVCIFERGDKVAVWHWDKEKQQPYYLTGVIHSNHDISHQVVRFERDNKLYLCHTSKIVSVEVVAQVEIEGDA